ncbi:electron transfer flavoprotein subunit beta/FixA family protein [Neobacillus sp. 179-C4.2 HS]|uniref:Electron transfer flavoprotein subunit beta n=1 Tax=Neobacillus driksii TaxID=3035913 RepID=A0ABV4YXH7_9BACI|nr:electron transfer flavoprotein subunit beta/FixA family protein [Neobacillus sp. 179.-C4.2 HS]MDP5192698.1 electron transfer flavoprotein subunit beta/FixA family protein [Neobacillus sp. 179.-C4.2 HS]
MNIFVVIKRTFDTEEKIVIKNGKISEDEAEFIINPYDEYAIEEAIKLREEHGGEVTVVTIGEDEAEKQLRTALAMGADIAVLINNEDLTAGDPFTTATILAAFLKEKDPDIILAGNVTVDGSTGQVGPRLAEELGMAVVTSITKLVVNGDKAVIERDVEGDTEIVEAKLPLLVTCQQGLNEPRYPSLPGIMKAKKKPLEALELDDLDLEEEDVEAKLKTIEIFLPPDKGAGKILEGDLEQQAKELINLLKTEAKVI